MKNELSKTRIKREIGKLIRSMDFVSKTYLARKYASESGVRRFFEIYQQLGLAWEFLGLQCRHWDGCRRLRDGHEVCRICGKVNGCDEFWLLLPRTGPKQIGRMVKPTSKKTFPNRKAGMVLADSIEFHGARLRVDAHNAHQSRIRDWEKPVTIAAERTVTLRDRSIECYLDDHLVCVRMPGDRLSKRRKKYGGFAWELRKKTLRNFPVLFDYDGGGNFLGLTILKPTPLRKRKK